MEDKCSNCGMQLNELRIETEECCRWVVMR